MAATHRHIAGVHQRARRVREHFDMAALTVQVHSLLAALIEVRVEASEDSAADQSHAGAG